MIAEYWLEAAADQAGSAAARAVDESDEGMSVMTQALLDIPLCQCAFLDPARRSRPIP